MDNIGSPLMTASTSLVPLSCLGVGGGVGTHNLDVLESGREQVGERRVGLHHRQVGWR